MPESSSRGFALLDVVVAVDQLPCGCVVFQSHHLQKAEMKIIVCNLFKSLWSPCLEGLANHFRGG